MKLYTDEKKTQTIQYNLSDIDPIKETLAVSAQRLNTLNTGVIYMLYSGKYRCNELDDTTYDFSNEDQIDVFFINDDKQYGNTCATNVSELVNDADYVSRQWVNHHMISDERLDASLTEFRTNLDSSFSSFRSDIDASFNQIETELSGKIDASLSAAISTIGVAVADMQTKIDTSINAAVETISVAVAEMEATIDASLSEAIERIDADVSAGVQWIYDTINSSVITDEFINSLN